MGRSKRIKTDQFAKCLEETLLAYARETSAESVEVVHNIGQETARTVSEAITQAGIGGTEYKNSIEVRDEKGRMKGKSIIWSPKHYRLTHLLENGHSWVVHGKQIDKEYPAHPHWSKAEKIAIAKLEKGLREAASK